MSYEDPSADFSEGQLKFASWYVSHKLLLKKIFIGFLIGLNVIFWGYGLYGLVIHYFIEGPRLDQALRELGRSPDLAAIRALIEPQSLEIGTVSILSGGKGKYDLSAKVSNQNPAWRTEFDYNFVADGKALPVRHGFILPNEEKLLINLGAESTARIRSASIEISNLRWSRVDAHEISDYEAWSSERLNFVFENVKFSPAVITDGITVSRVTFNARNLTAYSFWDVGFYIFLYRGSSLVTINYITLEEFISGQTRQVEVSWFESLPTVTQVKVVPEVNIFDPKVYMPVD